MVERYPRLLENQLQDENNVALANMLVTGIEIAGSFVPFFDAADKAVLQGDYKGAVISATIEGGITIVTLGAGKVAQGVVGTAAKVGDNYVDDAARIVSKGDEAVDAGGKGNKIVIGENMDRVKERARQIDAEVYDGPADMATNEKWIRNKMEKGYEVHDIGPDFKRRRDRLKEGIRPDSPFYNMERRTTQGYKNYIKEFNRNSKFDGGSPFIPWDNQ